MIIDAVVLRPGDSLCRPRDAAGPRHQPLPPEVSTRGPERFGQRRPYRLRPWSSHVEVHHASSRGRPTPAASRPPSRWQGASGRRCPGARSMRLPARGYCSGWRRHGPALTAVGADRPYAHEPAWRKASLAVCRDGAQRGAGRPSFLPPRFLRFPRAVRELARSN
jgi:hypothetical protein